MQTNISVIDIGSARVKYGVGRLTDGKVAMILHGKSETGLLGKARPDGEIDLNAVTSLLQALREILETVRQNGSSQAILVVATEALRKAPNQAEIVDRIKSEFGLDVNILSSALEADILFAGIQEDGDREIPVADIGGGSVQLAWGIGKSISIPTGTFALEKRFQKPGEIPTMEVYDTMRKEIAHVIGESLHGQNISAASLVVGTTCMRDFFDSAMCVAGIATHPKASYSAEDIDALFNIIAGKSYEDLAAFYPTNPKFMYGADKLLINVQELLKGIGAVSIIPTNDSISTGLIRLASTEDGLESIGIIVSNP